MTDQDTAISTSPSGTPRRIPRWIKLALIASLALNVLFFGAMAGAWWRGGGHGGFSGRGAGGTNIIGFIASLPSERRNELMQKSFALREQARALRVATRAAAQERANALLADPFDKQRFIDAQTRQVEADGKLRLLFRDIIAEAASSMSTRERRAFLSWREPRRGLPADNVDDAPPMKK